MSTLPPNLKKLLKDAEAQASTSSSAKLVAAALAASTRLTAEAAAKLMNLPLGSVEIGLDRNSFGAFKDALQAFAPPVTAAAIKEIPVALSLSPADIAAYIGRNAAALARQPLAAVPAIMVKSASAEARQRCANQYGKHFAEKASDRLIQALAIRSYSARRELVGEAASPQPADQQTMVLEMGSQPAPAPPPVRQPGREDALTMAVGHRARRCGLLRDSFHGAISLMRSEFEKKLSASAASLRRPLRESAMDLGSATDVCWLNATMRTLAPPKTVADVAADPKVKRIGIPRVLQRELEVTAATIGAATFRAAGSLTGQGLLIAVIDGEVDAKHPALKGRVLQKRNYTKESWGHPDLHGTAIAGIIASSSKTLTGVAPKAKIASYKIFATSAANQSSDFDAALALQQALEDGVVIANCSWGLGPATDGASREARAFDSAWDLGLIIVKSAGNGGHPMTSPADARGAIVVGATDRAGKSIPAYSGRGPIPARPGPDLVAPGGSKTGKMNGLLVGGTTGEIGAGTSYAAPHVVGAIALLLEQSPGLSPDEVKAALLGKCVAVAGSKKSVRGAGLLVL